MTTPAWISLGSNLGDRRAILDEAVLRLGQTPGVAVTAVSTYCETKAVGGPPGQGPFLNAAARLDTTLSPRELLGALQAIERDLGRVRTVRWGERTLDLDILIYGCKFVDEPDLKLPHPRLAVRRFVLEPLAEIAPEITDTITGRTVADLLANIDRQPRIVMLDESLAASVPRLVERIASILKARCLSRDQVQFPDGYMEQWLPGSETFSGRPGMAQIQRETTSIQTLLLGLPVIKWDHCTWLVTDFAVDVTRIKATSLDPDLVATVHDIDRMKLEAKQRPWLHRSFQYFYQLYHLPEPVLLVTKDDLPTRRSRNRPRTPIYWPEATEPDAIVAEVVAVCRGIEGG